MTGYEHELGFGHNDLQGWGRGVDKAGGDGAPMMALKAPSPPSARKNNEQRFTAESLETFRLVLKDSLYEGLSSSRPAVLVPLPLAALD